MSIPIKRLSLHFLHIFYDSPDADSAHKFLCQRADCLAGNVKQTNGKLWSHLQKSVSQDVISW